MRRLLLCIALVALAGCGGTETAERGATSTTTAQRAADTPAKPTTTKPPKRPQLKPENDPHLTRLADETVKQPWANKVERMMIMQVEYGPNEGRNDVTVYVPDNSAQELAKQICEVLAPIAFAEPTNAYQLSFITTAPVPDRLLYVDNGQPCSAADRPKR